jgi:hypothetical protein
MLEVHGAPGKQLLKEKGRSDRLRKTDLKICAGGQLLVIRTLETFVGWKIH